MCTRSSCSGCRRFQKVEHTHTDWMDVQSSIYMQVCSLNINCVFVTIGMFSLSGDEWQMDISYVNSLVYTWIVLVYPHVALKLKPWPYCSYLLYSQYTVNISCMPFQSKYGCILKSMHCITGFENCTLLRLSELNIPIYFI